MPKELELAQGLDMQEMRPGKVDLPAQRPGAASFQACLGLGQCLPAR